MAEEHVTRQVSDPGVLEEVAEVHQFLKESAQKLKRLPRLAVLLPREHDEEASAIFKGLSEEGFQVEGTAHTLYLQRERSLWLLNWQKETKSPATHLTEFVARIGQETGALRASEGPWLWPLSDQSVTSTISLSELYDPTARWWRKVLWALRLLPPENGAILERCILEHYGRETGYVFAYGNLFTRALWAISLPALIFGIAGVRPQSYGVDSLWWYVMQVLTVLWGFVLALFGSSRQAVLRSGTGLKRSLVAPSNVPEPGEPNAVVVPQEPAAAWEEGNQTFQARMRKMKDEMSEVLKDPEKMASLVSSCKLLEPDQHDGEESDHYDFRANPEYREEKSRAKRYAVAFAVTAVVLSLFLGCAAWVLMSALQLKSFLIFEWGECIQLRCDNAVQKHGFPALLADIGVDILLALVFMVGLGEACKALSYQLARVWNFRLMRTRYSFQSLVSLIIEVLGKVGIFVILGFIFLPSWSEEALNGSDQLPSEICPGSFDYDLCRAVSGCNTTYCCSGTLSCARQMLPFSLRRGLFERLRWPTC